jgi:hypothetical protein
VFVSYIIPPHTHTHTHTHDKRTSERAGVGKCQMLLSGHPVFVFCYASWHLSDEGLYCSGHLLKCEHFSRVSSRLKTKDLTTGCGLSRQL